MLQGEVNQSIVWEKVLGPVAHFVIVRVGKIAGLAVDLVVISPDLHLLHSLHSAVSGDD